MFSTSSWNALFIYNILKKQPTRAAGKKIIPVCTNILKYLYMNSQQQTIKVTKNDSFQCGFFQNPSNITRMFSQNIPNNLGMMYIWRPVWGKWGLAKTKMSCYRSMCGRCGDSKCSGRPIFIFFYKKKLDLRHDQTSCCVKHNILLTRNLPTDSGVRQWSHSLLIP